MTRLRSLVETDIIELDKLWRAYWTEYSLPNLNSKIIDSVAVDDKDRIIGYGQARHFVEAMLFLDPTARRRDRATATKQLMLEAFRGARKANIEEIYAFIKDPDFALIIQKHFGFKSIIDPGELLVRRL